MHHRGIRARERTLRHTARTTYRAVRGTTCIDSRILPRVDLFNWVGHSSNFDWRRLTVMAHPHGSGYELCNIAYLVIGANCIVRGKKVTSLARWPPNPSRCWALTWRTIGPMEDYWARSGGLLAEWPLSTLTAVRMAPAAAGPVVAGAT